MPTLDSMNGFLDTVNRVLDVLNGFLFHEAVVFVLLVTGIVFTIWTRFGQYRALTHGVQVVRGKYDDSGDPGAISHFQALSAALSATVGLGNIGGVALAVALGGPGAVFWMWIIGLVGMALKMTEVTQSMLYRNTDDPENPHGGPMFVVRDGLRKLGIGMLGSVVGGVFVITLLISAITGGNMFQAWNVAEVTARSFQVPEVVTGAVLAGLVASVIIGGIKRIGSFAGRIVPFMCVLYLLAAFYVIFRHLGEIPTLLLQIVRAGLPSWLGGESPDAEGAFFGASFGVAAMWGVKRALFSSEAGQGSAPIAHSAAKTDEPVREGIVAGLEPFIDTVVVCTLTALVILLSGAWNRGPEALIPDNSIRIVDKGPAEDGAPGEREWTVELDALPPKTIAARHIQSLPVGGDWHPEDDWHPDEGVFVAVEVAGAEGPPLQRLSGKVIVDEEERLGIEWSSIAAPSAPTPTRVSDPSSEEVAVGLYGDYAGASLTAHAFDRETPGLGRWLVTLAAWLFALSTMISWSYYGEQGVIYLFGGRGVLLYKVIYCVLIFVTTLGFIKSDTELDLWTTLGLGVMLWANIPIMWIFGPEAMRAYRDYENKLRSGDFDGSPRT